MWCSSIFKRSGFQILVTQLLTFTCTFLLQNLSSHYGVGYLVVEPCTCKEYIQFLAMYFLISQSKHYIIRMASIGTDQYCIRPSAIYARARTMGRAMQSYNARISNTVKNNNLFLVFLTHTFWLALHPLLLLQSIG